MDQTTWEQTSDGWVRWVMVQWRRRAPASARHADCEREAVQRPSRAPKPTSRSLRLSRAAAFGGGGGGGGVVWWWGIHVRRCCLTPRRMLPDDAQARAKSEIMSDDGSSVHLSRLPGWVGKIHRQQSFDCCEAGRLQRNLASILWGSIQVVLDQQRFQKKATPVRGARKLQIVLLRLFRPPHRAINTNKSSYKT